MLHQQALPAQQPRQEQAVHPWGGGFEAAQVTFVVDDEDSDGDEAPAKDTRVLRPRRISDDDGDEFVAAKRLVREKKQPYNENGERVYCICRTPDNGKFMIGCDNCKDWYHGACVNITERMGQSIKTYLCPFCIQAKNDQIYNRK
ncbi:CXXC-type zinc finger protein 1 [Podochytrium sp. JEL0797]|nr:CXXC-type zinc finger protein 1 [Podochytrium sp. JEL0797]